MGLGLSHAELLRGLFTLRLSSNPHQNTTFSLHDFQCDPKPIVADNSFFNAATKAADPRTPGGSIGLVTLVIDSSVIPAQCSA